MSSWLLVFLPSFAATIALMAPPNDSVAVCLNGHPSVPFEFEHSDAVFIGRVRAERPVPASDGYYEGHGYTVAVRELLRGKLSRSVDLFSENSSGRFPMQVDSSYLPFVHRERGRIMVDNCGNSGLLTVAAAAIDTVRQLQRKASR
jgi:hypothetical protein